jgi:Zn-dependent peptidase ImmA (M78 family)
MVKLDLIELADLTRPEELVAEIMRQNPQMQVPVPIEEIAQLAGISKIAAIEAAGFEGTLITNSEKSEGHIFFNSGVPRPRQRFTIGHELGHFLLPWHRQIRFDCSSEDLSSKTKATWELEANTFSAELLMPHALLAHQLSPSAEFELAEVIRVRDAFGTSLESTIRRIVERSELAYAVVFSKENKVRYSVFSEYFTARLSVRKGTELPGKSLGRLGSSSLDDWNALDAHWWLDVRQGGSVIPESIYEQTLVQDDGYKVTLLMYEADE